MIAISSPKGNIKALQAIRNIEDATYAGIRKGFQDYGHSMRQIARAKILNPPKTGRYYKRPKPSRKRYRASRKGESPANRTGNLRSSVGFQLQGVTRMEFGYREEGTKGDARYGRILELELDRPALQGAVDETINVGHTYFEGRISGELKG